MSPPINEEVVRRDSTAAQLHAVKEMEQMTSDLRSMLSNTEELGQEENTLDHFERDLRELNQRNALQRVQSIVHAKGEGTWNKSLNDKVVTVPQHENEEADEQYLLNAVGGGMLEEDDGSDADNFALNFCEEGDPPFGAPETEPPLKEVAPQPPIQQHEGAPARRRSTMASPDCNRPVLRSADRQSFRIVGSMTPGMVKSMHRPSHDGTPRRVSIRHEGIPQRGSILLPHSPMSLPTGGENLIVPSRRESRLSRRPSSARKSISHPFIRPQFRQKDTSSTRITGRVDYSALLREQQSDLDDRRVSMKDYKSMLKQVEEYQQSVLAALDKQFVFMQSGGSVTGLKPQDSPMPAASENVAASNEFHAVKM